MARIQRRSRLARRESRRLFLQSGIFIVLTVALLGMIVVWGVPAMVRFAGFLGEVKSSDQPIEESDTIAPFAPQLAIPYEATTSAKIDVSGFAEAGSTVRLFNNGSKVEETEASDQGEFSFSQVSLNDGNNELTALSVDRAGNESAQSRSRNVVWDQQPPELEITNPITDGGKATSEVKILTVEGKSSEDAKVYVNDRLAMTESEGTFTVRVNLNEGENQILVRAVDVAGNQAEESFVVSFFE